MGSFESKNVDDRHHTEKVPRKQDLLTRVLIDLDPVVLVI
jgi:hypothetical protein